ncbi:MAG: DUF3179 domain-containing protein, partial [Actinomycetota bacterium]
MVRSLLLEGATVDPADVLLAQSPGRAARPIDVRSLGPLAAAIALAVAACSPPTNDEANPAPPAGLDPDDVVSGGPPPDGIPSIDDPAFVEARHADFLAPQEPVILLEHAGLQKVYPIRILMWHEIVNDEVAGLPVAVTYCPLCNTGVAFRRELDDGRVLDFGTTGKLLHSNLVMYDRQTGSWWVQATGDAFDGPLTGRRLEALPAQMVAWADARGRFADALVLSPDTGFDRDYGRNPYVHYDGGRG